MKPNPSFLTIGLTIAIVGIILWRNYGVIKVGETLKPENKKTTEEKELSKAITKLGTAEKGQIITTTFGTYELGDAGWVKTKEIWDLFNQRV